MQAGKAQVRRAAQPERHRPGITEIVELGRPFGLTRADDPESGVFPQLEPGPGRDIGSPGPPALNCTAGGRPADGPAAALLAVDRAAVALGHGAEYGTWIAAF